MAIIKCPECGRKISDQAKECPGCGFPMKRTSSILGDFLKGNDEKSVDKVYEEEDVEESEPSDIHKGEKEKIQKKRCKSRGKRWKIVFGVFLVIILLLIGIQSLFYYWVCEVLHPRQEAYTDYIMEFNAANDQICRYDNALSEYNDKAEEIGKMNKALDKAIEQAEAVLDSQDKLNNGEKTLALINTSKEARDNQIETPEQMELIRTFNLDRSLEEGKLEDIEVAIRELKKFAYLGVSSEYTVKLMTKELEAVDYSEYLKKIEAQTKALEGSSTISEKTAE